MSHTPAQRQAMIARLIVIRSYEDRYGDYDRHATERRAIQAALQRKEPTA